MKTRLLMLLAAIALCMATVQASAEDETASPAPTSDDSAVVQSEQPADAGSSEPTASDQAQPAETEAK